MGVSRVGYSVPNEGQTMPGVAVVLSRVMSYGSFRAHCRTRTLAERITEKDWASFQLALKSQLGRAAVQSRAAMSASLVMPSNRAEPTSFRGAVGSLRFAWAEGPRSRDRAKS